MGGNSRIINRATGEILGYAEKIDLKIFDRQELTQRLLGLFFYLNTEFWRRTNELLWKSEDLISGKVFSGSTEFLFKGSIWDDEFVKYKQTVGDIDITFPEQYYEEFALMMQEYEGKTFHAGIKYLGQDRNTFGTTFLSVFEYTSGENVVRIQIDFEAAKYEDGSPSKWARFSHNSSWEDIRDGCKGVHHKFLLINIVRALSIRKDVAIATPTSKPGKVKLVSGKRALLSPRTLAFSVDRGLREKYTLLHDNGQSVIFDDKIVMKEIPVEDSNYITDINLIFSAIFDKFYSDADLENFYSFKGLFRIMKRYMKDEEIENCFTFSLQENIFGKHAQILEKNNEELDCEIKDKYIERFLQEFPFLAKHRELVETLKEAYYNNFKYETL